LKLDSATGREPDLRRARSADGTEIGFEVVGDGPPLVVVHGIGADRSQWGPTVPALARRFTVYLVDRRGRGLSVQESGPYSLDREGEDIVAVAKAAGEPVSAFGHGYGGMCVLQAALLDAPFARILIDESPAGQPGPEVLPGVVPRLVSAIESGDLDAALEIFLREVVGLEDEQIAGMRRSPMWQARVGVVGTVVRELQTANEHPRDADRLGRMAVPTRFVAGKESTPLMRESARLLHESTPGSEFVEVETRMFTAMYADPAGVADDLGAFFLSS
jgi:pimeloyl-ACP methyl ester carboxylesterase